MTNVAHVVRSGTQGIVRRLAPLALLLYLQGCSIITGGDCAGVGHYGVIATVVDARTQQPPTVPATVTLRDGSYIEVIAKPNFGPGIYVGASDRAGLYSLTAEATGYQTFVQNGIYVRSGSCGEVTTNDVKVQLSAVQ